MARLAVQSQLRANLRALIRTMTEDAFGKKELSSIERELINSLTIAEAVGMPSSVPGAGQALVLTRSQLGTVKAIVGRFRDSNLKACLAAEIASAVGVGRMQIR